LFELSEKKKGIIAQAGHLLVHGGPGSGKTTISIIKADLLVSELPRHTQKVLFLSFARATVARILEALDEHTGNKAKVRRRVEVDTYHAFFWRILKTHAYLLGMPRKLEILTPSAQAVALSQIRHEFGPIKKLTPAQKIDKIQRESNEVRRLAFQDGKVCFDLFADLTATILTESQKIRELISSVYPVIVLDEFQDTNAEQWRVVQRLGIASTLIALADAEQRIYDFIGADPERLNHFREAFKPKEFDLGDENHRSTGTDIALFGNHILSGQFQNKYQGMRLFTFEANGNQAIASLKGHTLQARKRLIEAKGNSWTLAILVPTKKMMRQVSDAFREKDASMPSISHHAAIDMEGAILAAEVIAFLLQCSGAEGEFRACLDLLCNFFRGRGGDAPSASDISESIAILKAFDKATICKEQGKSRPANSIVIPLSAGYETCVATKRAGNPDDDWTMIRVALAECGCKRLGQVAEEAKNVRLLDRGTELRESLALDWRQNGSYKNALQIVRQAFTRHHFAVANKPESGVIVMNMHKAKGKQFDEVIIFEGWPRTQKGKIVSNPDRIVRGNVVDGDMTNARQTFRVSVTRAKMQTTILTPKNDPCVLLLRRAT
jgi:DNA helicase II / ATP-dependent DNA helicase PcrA